MRDVGGIEPYIDGSEVLTQCTCGEKQVGWPEKLFNIIMFDERGVSNILL